MTEPVYSWQQMELIYSCCKYLDYAWEILKTQLHAPLRCRELFSLHTKKAIKTQQISWNSNIAKGYSSNVYFGPWGNSIELCLTIHWKEIPNTIVKAIYEKPTQIN